MLERGKMDRDVVEIVGIDSLVPKEHLLRKIDKAVDFSRLYEMVEPLYCEDNGRPSIDPVVLFKMVLIQHLYGLPSLRRTAEEVSLNVAYRWFLGYTLQEETPHFSTVSYNFRHRFTEKTVDLVFRWILEEVAEAGYLSPKAVFIDGTHIKANANTKKQVKVQIPVASKHYAKELMEEVNADREAHGKKPFDDNDEPPTPTKKRRDNTSKKKLARRKKEKLHTVTRSVTDPDSGLFVKGEHKRQFAYEAHTACDKHGFVLETVITPGNAEVRGLYNYYAIANDSFKIGRFANLMKYSMYKTFACKYKTNVHEIKRRYCVGGLFTIAYDTRAGRKITTFYRDGFKRKESATKFDNVSELPQFSKYAKTNTLKQRVERHTCELCGKDCRNLEIHQVKKLKDLKGNAEWVLLMRKRRRKTLVVCPECHKLIHS